jgi:hypothetical protein
MKQFNPRALSLAVALLVSSWVAAQNTALTSGAWETGTNWSSGAAPLATDAVVVPAGLAMTVNAAGDFCASLTIANGGSVTINNGDGLAIGGFLSNAGALSAVAGSTLTFNGTANSTVTGGGSYTIAGTVVLDMGSPATYLDVQDANFITGINTGGKYYFTFTQGTFRMDNAGALKDSYNSGSATALTIPFGVTIESDNGSMNLCRNAPSGSALLSGQLFMNGGTVTVQTGQALNSGQDFHYSVNGGTPQLYVSSGTLYIGAGFNANAGTDYIDFHQTGGTIVCAEDGWSKAMTFQLANNVGGKTFMSGGLIILQDACDAAAADLDMGGANVAATLYSVTGGTVQLGYAATQAGASFFGINAEPATNYPNIDFQSGTAKTVSAWNGGVINMLSLYINANMTYNASGFSTTNIMSNNGTFAFDDEGTFTPGNNTVEFTGAVNQLISSSALANVTFYNLKIANTSGNATLGVNTTVSNQLSFTSGLLDASKKTLTLSNGAVAVTGASASTYVITGNGFANFGTMSVAALPVSTATLFPIGTTTYYLPAYVNPGTNAGTTYTAYVFKGATTNAVANGPSFSATILSNMLNAIWNISQTAGTGSATLNLDWTTAETALEGAIFQTAGTGIGIIQYLGAGSGWSTPTGTGNVATATSSSSFSSFSQFAVVDNLFILPVVVTDFNAVLNNNNTVQLTWSASDEMEISDFEVQRSTDGSNYTTIGTVQANATESDYSLIDPNPAPGVNYYRLIIQETDGSVGYSNVRTVDLSSTAAIGIYPNPTANQINVSVSNATPDLSIRLVSLTGQVLQTITPGATGASVSTINVSQYPPAIYLVQLVNSQKVLQVSGVVVTH